MKKLFGYRKSGLNNSDNNYILDFIYKSYYNCTLLFTDGYENTYIDIFSKENVSKEELFKFLSDYTSRYLYYNNILYVKQICLDKVQHNIFNNPEYLFIEIKDINKYFKENNIILATFQTTTDSIFTYFPFIYSNITICFIYFFINKIRFTVNIFT